MKTLLISSCLLLVSFIHRSAAIDAVPEPGLLIYGQVFSQSAPEQTVNVSAMAWNSPPGGTGTAPGTATYPVPPSPVAGAAGYYVARVPYESPNPAGLTLTGSGLFDLVATGTDAHHVGFLVTPSSGGPARPARIKAVNGVANTGNPLEWPAFQNWSDITTAKRGGTLRLDLIIDAAPSTTLSYDDWIKKYFSNSDPRGARDADPDGDGMSNEQEFAADTSPGDAADLLRILSISAAGGGTTAISWASKPGLSYTIEYSDPLSAGWITHGSYKGNADQTVVDNLPGAAAQPRRFWRVRIVR